MRAAPRIQEARLCSMSCWGSAIIHTGPSVVGSDPGAVMVLSWCDNFPSAFQAISQRQQPYSTLNQTKYS